MTPVERTALARLDRGLAMITAFEVMMVQQFPPAVERALDDMDRDIASMRAKLLAGSDAVVTDAHALAAE